MKNGNSIAILSTGTIGNNVINALESIADTSLFSHYHFPFVKPLDIALLQLIGKKYNQIITIEEGTINGGFGSLVTDFLCANNYTISIKKLGIPDRFIDQGTVKELHQISGLDSQSLVDYLKTLL